MILLRVDSSFEIGTGHVSRCLNLAGLLKSKGLVVEFLCQQLPGNIISEINNRGFTAHALTEKDNGLEKIKELKPKWLVIDHYGIDHTWEKQISPEVKIFVIDDLMNRKHHCHVLLDQNYRRNFSAYKSLIPPSAMLLAGPKHCLLPENLKKPSGPKAFSDTLKILSFFGGSDSSGELLKLAQALLNQSFTYEISLVALSSHKHLDQLKALRLPENIHLLIDPPNWHQLIEQHDFYIGSGGTVTWERLFLGLPGAVIAVAKNQEIPSKELAEDGYQIYLGSTRHFNYSTVRDQISQIISDFDSLKTMSDKGLSLVDRFHSAELFLSQSE